MAQTDNVVLNPLLYSKLTYNPDKDLRAVAWSQPARPCSW